MTAPLDSGRLDRISTTLERLLDRVERSETHYEVLGLNPQASPREAAEAYSRIIEMLQPAREAMQGSTGETSDKIAAVKKTMATRLDRIFGRVTLAFSILSMPERKEEYDRHLCAKLSGAAPTAEEVFGQAGAENEGADEDDDRRWDRRFNLYIAAQITGYDRDGGRWEEPAETIDVSKTGLTFRIRKSVRLGTIVHVSLPLPTKLRSHGVNDPNYNVYAVVRRVEPSNKNIRVVAVEFVGEEPPALYLERPWTTFLEKTWDGSERRRKPRHIKNEVIWIEYFNEAMQSMRREAGRTENVSDGGMRVRVKSAPGDFDYVLISYPDGRRHAFATVCDRFVAEDSFERLCLRFINDDKLSKKIEALAKAEPAVAALAPVPADAPGSQGPQGPQISAAPIARGQTRVTAELLCGEPFRRRRILVADDDAPLRMTLGKILNTAGYEVTLVEDGKAAVAKAAAEHPDLVITDALMPKLHGFLVCRMVKGFSPPPKVIMLTAVYTKPGYEWEARNRYGADDLLTKPFRVPELLAAIERQLSPPEQVGV